MESKDKISKIQNNKSMEGNNANTVLTADVIESCFESLNHKYNVVRKLFWKERCKRSSDRLIYQPKVLRDICRKYEFDFIIDSINDTMSKRRDNYFNSFVEIIGENTMQGGWEFYISS